MIMHNLVAENNAYNMLTMPCSYYGYQHYYAHNNVAISWQVLQNLLYIAKNIRLGHSYRYHGAISVLTSDVWKVVMDIDIDYELQSEPGCMVNQNRCSLLPSEV